MNSTEIENEKDKVINEEAENNNVENKIDYNDCVDKNIKDSEKIEQDNDNKSEKKYKKENSELRKKIAELEKQNKDVNDKYLRILAEYDNFRKRSSKEKDNSYAKAYEDVLKVVLPVSDNLELALKYSNEDPEKIIEGVKMTLKQFSAGLSSLGISEIPNEVFDEKYHNAVMTEHDDSRKNNDISEVFQKGYIKGDKVLRFSMVKVIKND